MVDNLVFANSTILSCFFFFLIINLDFLIRAVIAQIINFTAELVTHIGMPTKGAKTEIEAHPVGTKAKISK